MGNTTGQRSDGFNLLGHLKLLLKPFLLTNVPQIDYAALRIAVSIVIYRSANNDRYNFTILCVSTRLSSKDIFSSHDGFNHLLSFRPVFFRDKHVHFFTLAFLQGPAEYFRKSMVKKTYV